MAEGGYFNPWYFRMTMAEHKFNRTVGYFVFCHHAFIPNCEVAIPDVVRLVARALNRPVTEAEDLSRSMVESLSVVATPVGKELTTYAAGLIHGQLSEERRRFMTEFAHAIANSSGRHLRSMLSHRNHVCGGFPVWD